MQSLIESIRQLPREEQLEMALFQLEQLLSTGDSLSDFWAETFGLTRSEAKIFSLLYRRSPRTVPRSGIHAAIVDLNGTDTQEKLVDVLVCKMRRKLKTQGFPDSIKTSWGSGYYIPDIDHLPKPGVQVQPLREFEIYPGSRKGSPWTAQEDATLMEMLSQGETISEAAWELGRTERACTERLMKVRGHA